MIGGVAYAGSSNKKKAVIIGGVVGGVGLLLIVLAVFLWYRLSRKPKTAERGQIRMIISESSLVLFRPSIYSCC